MNDPWHIVLWSHMELLDIERLEGLNADWDRIVQANHFAVAQHSPADLKKLTNDWKARAGIYKDIETTKHDAIKMIEELQSQQIHIIEGNT